MQTLDIVNEVEIAEGGVDPDMLSQRGMGAPADMQFAIRMLGERLPAELLQGRLRIPARGAGEIISGLRQTFQRFISRQIEDARADTTSSTGFGFGHPAFEEVDVNPLVEAASKALQDLTELYDVLPEGSPTTLPQRDAIIEAQALLQQFLFDFKDFAPDGALDRSSLSGAVKYCIATSRGLGKLSVGYEAIKLQMVATAA